MLNAIIYRPAEKPFDRLLENAAVTYQPSEDNAYPEPVPYKQERGVYFLSDIILHQDLFSLPNIRFLTQANIADIYQSKHYRMLQATILTRGIASIQREQTRDVEKPARLRRPKMTQLAERSENEEPLPVHDFGLEELNVNLEVHPPPPPLPLQDHLPPPLEVNPPPPILPVAPPEQTADEQISEIWNQLFVDIFQLSPNRRGAHNPAYCTLTADQILKVTEDMFQQTKLPFTDVIIKAVPLQTWDTIFFDRFFPSTPLQANVPSSKMQHFPTCAYYQLWRTLCTQVDSAIVTTVRRQLLIRWRALYWLPYSGSDRMWSARKTMTGHSIQLPGDSDGPAVQIAINSRIPNLTLNWFTLV